MHSTVKGTDIRILKTRAALSTALYSLLGKRRFGKITVLDICGVAHVSRATFYTHFVDKYDLLRHWLGTVRAGMTGAENICAFMCDNTKFLSNLLKEPDAELIETLCEFLVDIFTPDPSEAHAGPDAERTVVSQFCAGGLINLALLYVRGKAPSRECVLQKTQCVLDTVRTALDGARVTSVQAR
jgi:AcrR family transcriptional regulator